MEHKETNEDIISVASLISGKNNSIFVETKIETNNQDEIEEEKENVNDEYIIENEEEDNDLEKKGDIVNDSNQTQEIINQKKDIIISDINTGEKNVFIEMEKRRYVLIITIEQCLVTIIMLNYLFQNFFMFFLILLRKMFMI